MVPANTEQAKVPEQARDDGEVVVPESRSVYPGSCNLLAVVPKSLRDIRGLMKHPTKVVFKSWPFLIGPGASQGPGTSPGRREVVVPKSLRDIRDLWNSVKWLI